MARVGRAERERARQVGDRIRFLRKALGLSQEKLAERSGMHRTYVGQIERGEVLAGAFKLADIADALGVDVGELVHGRRRAS
jgi:transcriptional regulator with XRE-family HTH domain